MNSIKLATVKPEQLQMIMDRAKALHNNDGVDKSSAIIMATLGQLLNNAHVQGLDMNVLADSFNTMLNLD